MSKLMLGEDIRNLSDNLSALRDFVALIGSVLDTHEKQFIEKSGRDLIPLFVVLASAMPQVKGEEDLPLPAVLREKFEGDFTIEPNVDGTGISVRVEGDAGERFRSALTAYIRQRGHRSLLYRSALISLISAAEWFLSRVVRQYYLRYPDAAGIKDKTLTLEDLKNIGTIEEAQERLIDLRIDEIMRGGLDDWLKFLSSQIKLSMGYLTTHRDVLIEVYQRRNVVVHNNGVVHPTYITKVSPDLRKDVKVGQQLPVDTSYLGRAIDLVELCFVLIAAELWKQLDGTDEERSKVLTDVAIEGLKTERWTLGQGISYFVMNDKHLPERAQMVGRINYWQSIKWQGRLEEVRDEIEHADFSAKDDLFNLVRHVLLDQFSTAMESLPSLLSNNKLSLEHLKTWPIFRELRKTNECEELIRKYEHEGEKSDVTINEDKSAAPAAGNETIH